MIDGQRDERRPGWKESQPASTPPPQHLLTLPVLINIATTYACGVAWAAVPAYRGLRREAGGLALPGLWRRAVRAAGPNGLACAAFAAAAMAQQVVAFAWS